VSQSLSGASRRLSRVSQSLSGASRRLSRVSRSLSGGSRRLSRVSRSLSGGSRRLSRVSQSLSGVLRQRLREPQQRQQVLRVLALVPQELAPPQLGSARALAARARDAGRQAQDPGEAEAWQAARWPLGGQAPNKKPRSESDRGQFCSKERKPYLRASISALAKVTNSAKLMAPLSPSFRLRTETFSSVTSFSPTTRRYGSLRVSPWRIL